MEEEPFEPSNYSIQIHKILHDAQQSHGLTHDDYNQYHTYLTNRISRLRHSQPVHKRQSGKKHAYNKREITIEEANGHENFILIALYITERAWAHAMELKSASEGGNPSGGKNKRNMYIKRMKKAVKHVQELEDLVMAICNETTKLEMVCYAAWMRGNHCCETRDWQASCQQYAIALQTCHQLSIQSKKEEKLQLSDFFLSRADNILQPILRYCQYELQKEGKLSQEKIDEIVQVSVRVQGGGDEVKPHDKQTDVDGSAMSISFRGMDISLEDATVRMVFIKIQNKEEVLDNLKKSNGAKANVKDAKLMELLNSYDDAIEIVEKLFGRYQDMASGPAVNMKRTEYSDLLGYCKFEKLKLVMNRNEKMVNNLRQRDREMDVTKTSRKQIISQDDADAKYKIVEEIARLYDVLLQDARSATEFPGRAEEDVEDEFVLEANANVLRIRALRCYYIGRMYASDIVAKYNEALALFDQASILATEAAEEIAACQDMEDADALIEGVASLESELTAAKCRTKACAYLASCDSGASTVTSGLSLLGRLDDFDAGGKTHRLAHVPPTVLPVAAKPFFFDVANNYVKDFPMDEIEAYVTLTKPREKKGLLRWFR